MKKTYYIIIPVFNEEKYIEKVIQKVQKYINNIIVVDDGSTDNTPNVLKAHKDILAICLNKNQGKGAAMKQGIELAWKKGADAVIFVDGDNQHDARHIPEFMEDLDKGSDIVLGVRVLKGEIPFFRMIGNHFFIFLIKFLFNIHIVDALCGFRALTKKGYKKVKWESNDYGVEVEMITLMGRKKINYTSVVVDTIYHEKYKGFSIKDGLKIVMKLPYWRFRKI